MLHDPVHNTVIRIRALVIALQSFPPLIPGDSQRNAVLGTQFFQLGHDAGCDDWRGFGVQEVHEGFVELEFGLNGVREEIGVDEDGIGRAEGGVGLEEERGGDLGTGIMSAGGMVMRVGWATFLAWPGTLASSSRPRSRLPFGSSFCYCVSVTVVAAVGALSHTVWHRVGL